MDYNESIKQVVATIKTEKVASDPTEGMSMVEKAAYEIIESLEKLAEDEDVEIPEEVAEKLNLDGEDEDDSDDEKDEDDEDDEDDDVKEANEVFVKSLYLEKSATEAWQESQIMKAAALKVLHAKGKCSEEDVEKLASYTLDDIEIDE